MSESLDKATAEYLKRFPDGAKLVKGKDGAPDCIVIENFGAVLDRAIDIEMEKMPRPKRRRNAR